MANKVVPGFTQVPVVQQDIRDIHIVALDEGATQFNLTVTYNVYDDQAGLRASRTITQQTATAPGAPFLAAVLAAVNTVEGTA